jgi:hypothetical protein
MATTRFSFGLLTLLVLMFSSANAGGLYIREFGQPSQGMSGDYSSNEVIFLGVNFGWR